MKSEVISEVFAGWPGLDGGERFVMVREEGVYAKFAGDKLGNERAMDLCVTNWFEECEQIFGG